MKILALDASTLTGSAAVYGQGGSFETTASNRGGRSRASLSSPLGVAVNAEALFVHDAGNRRVLVFKQPRSRATAAKQGRSRIAADCPSPLRAAGSMRPARAGS